MPVYNFTKMHGTGNDYIYFNCMTSGFPDPEEFSVRLSDRHKGIGGDGIVMILPSDKADFKMRIFNADGSEAKMCGNASRCIGKYVYEKRLTDKSVITLETLSGIKTIYLELKDGKVVSVSVNMGKPAFETAAIPAIWDKPVIKLEKIIIGGTEYTVTCLSMGNPHCVVFTEGIDELPLEKIGPLFENNSAFPERINTEFISKTGDGILRMRVWERGSGETLACGTGACAAYAAAADCGLIDGNESALIKLNGGELKIEYLADKSILMTGPAEKVFEGKIKI